MSGLLAKLIREGWWDKPAPEGIVESLSEKEVETLAVKGIVDKFYNNKWYRFLWYSDSGHLRCFEVSNFSRIWQKIFG